MTPGRHHALWAPTIVVTLAVLSLAAAAQTPPAVPADPSKHEVRYVTVDQDVTLEVLDFGGSGRPLVLLAGSGNTAHVFDAFAPKLLDCCHVYAVTRRGYGASSRPSSGYGDQRLADDVFQVIEKERIAGPVLVGHSMAGGELTTIGRQHSDRISGLVYLDALGDLEDDPPADKEWAALQQKLPPGLNPAKTCAPADRSTFAAYRQSVACEMGFALPESEWRQAFESDDGRVGAYKTPGWVSREIGKGQVFRRDYSNIRVPVLALMNGSLTSEEMLTATGYMPKNEDERMAIDQFMARSRIVFGRWTDKLKRHVPDARVVYFPNAGHYVFITREADVLREIRGFVASLGKKSPR